MLVLKNCKLIEDLTEGVDFNCGDIVIENSLIKEILPCGAQIKGKYKEYDVGGKTVLPGLINAHVHLAMARDVDYSMVFDTVPKRTLDELRFARFLLESGYTTVRDCGDDFSCPANSLRDEINAGAFTGPNILTSGPTLCPSEPGLEALAWMAVLVDTPEEVRKRARLNYQKQIDFLKLYGTGSMMTKGGVPGQQIMDDDEILAGVKVAKLKGSYAAIHAHGRQAIEAAIRCGVRTIEHATYINEAACKMLSGREDVGIIPTVSVVNDWGSCRRCRRIDKRHWKICAPALKMPIITMCL